jgi:hypothetical protein
MNWSRSKVSWIQCCQVKGKGGINLVNPANALTAMMTKWIMKVVEPGSSNLHLMLRFRLSHCQPYSGGRWAPNLEYFTLPRFQAKRGSKVWNRIGTSWKALVKDIQGVSRFGGLNLRRSWGPGLPSPGRHSYIESTSNTYKTPRKVAPSSRRSGLAPSSDSRPMKGEPGPLPPARFLECGLDSSRGPTLPLVLKSGWECSKALTTNCP